MNFLNLTNIADLSNATGISRSTLQRRRKHPEDMTLRELRRCAIVIGLSKEAIANEVWDVIKK